MISTPQRPAAENRTYRNRAMVERLTSFQVTVQETDLMVQADEDLTAECREAILIQRHYIEHYLQRYPAFRTTLRPWQCDEPAPEIIRTMTEAGRATGVGPMAAVAGAIAETVGQFLCRHSREVIVENGGDIFLSVTGEVTIALFAGDSPFSMRIGLKVDPGKQPLAVCTSSGTVGHSLSSGRADAVCIVARQCALADAAATAVANHITAADTIPEAIRLARSIDGVMGVVAICGEQLGMWGDLHIVKIERGKIS